MTRLPGTDRRPLPVVHARGVTSYYDYLRQPGGHRVCTGTACRFSSTWRAPAGDDREVRCLGYCYAAPADSDTAAGPIPTRALTDEPVVLRHILGAPRSLRQLYAAKESDQILASLDKAGLRGRGGAAYPTAAKWRAARDTSGARKFVVGNGDEGDPGSFVDRLLLEQDPHAVLAGMVQCARTIGAGTGILYLRAEYPAAAVAVKAAIAEVRALRLIPDELQLDIHVGAGSYVCGEETALLQSLAGLRGEAQPKPPYPTERGLYGCPTVVQNVETLAVVPWVTEGHRRPPSKAFSLSGAVRTPGVVEARFGITLAELLERGADGPAAGATWKMALVGGPMGRVIPAANFDVPLAYDTLPGLGHGGIVVLGEDVTVRALAEHLFDFAMAESCGACTPCRVGTTQLASRRDAADLARLLDTLELGSLCGFGQGVPRPLRDLLAHYPGELFP